MSKPLTSPHWSFWAICIIALIWNFMGCTNFIMQVTPGMLVDYPEAAKSLITSRPLWATIAFAVAVFGGLAGDALLLLRKKFAYCLFIVSLLGTVVTNIHTFQVSTAIDIWVGSLISLIVAASLIWYAKLAHSKGWLG